ncbi:hypothetical protein SK128_005797, partial [Halocaridina rubra]
ARTVAFLRRTCFGSCNRYPECMPLLTSDRDGSRTLDLTPQSRGRYRLSHGDYRELNSVTPGQAETALINKGPGTRKYQDEGKEKG